MSRKITLWGLTWSPLNENVWSTVPDRFKKQFKEMNAEFYEAPSDQAPDHIFVGVYPNGWPNDNAPIAIMHMHKSGMGIVSIAKLVNGEYENCGKFRGGSIDDKETRQ